MIENTTTSPARAEWPIPPQRLRKRRDSRVAYHHSAKHFHRNVPLRSLNSTSVSPPRDSASASASASAPASGPASRPSVQIHQQSLPAGQQSNLNGFEDLDFWDFHHQASATLGNQTFDPTAAHQDGHTPVDISWQSSMLSYYPSIPPPDSPHSPTDNTSSPQVGQARLLDHDLAISWDAPIPNGSSFNSDVDVGSLPDSNFGRFGSIDSMDVSNASTLASSMSENYVLPPSGSGVDSPGCKIQMKDLSLSDAYRSHMMDGYFETLQNVNSSSSNPGNAMSPTSPLYPEPIPFDTEFATLADWNVLPNMSPYNSGFDWSSATMTDLQQLQNIQIGESSPSSQIPWSHPNTSYDANASTGVVAFEPSPSPMFGHHLSGERYLETHQRELTPQADFSPLGDDSEYGEWQNVPSYPTSSVPSHSSPHSAGSPFSLIDTPYQTPSPRPHNNDHRHIFTAYPGITKQSQKLPRGRQRALTTKEKKEAREVREAKACWACHLSKIKCSPCSPGSPCKKCAELMGKRRFCLLPCFNDPLESLHTFMVPEYLTAHHTKASIEKFVSENATGWGSHEIRIRMMWGYWKPLEATVVILEIGKDSNIGIHHQASANGTSRRTLVEKASPPLGIPLAAMDDMQEEYRHLVHSIVRDDLIGYMRIAYDDQNSDLAERLLTTIGGFYCASKVAGNESELLQQALKIHVTFTILERSLILDEDSMYAVESCLKKKYPKRSAARCVQRQVKLAFFEVQRQRVAKVLEAWGNMMWTSNKRTSSDKKWAISFSVFLTLILAIDKTLSSGYLFCEGNIAHRGFKAESERKIFQELVRLTQAELFERCKEIFHSSFKTRKNGKEACNPIRDGIAAFKEREVDKSIEGLVDELRDIAREFGQEIRSHRTSLPQPSEHDRPYSNAARLACIFLDDFLDR